MWRELGNRFEGLVWVSGWFVGYFVFDFGD